MFVRKSDTVESRKTGLELWLCRLQQKCIDVACKFVSWRNSFFPPLLCPTRMLQACLLPALYLETVTSLRSIKEDGVRRPHYRTCILIISTFPSDKAISNLWLQKDICTYMYIYIIMLILQIQDFRFLPNLLPGLLGTRDSSFPYQKT